ncbi:hypothetical protein MauCBS54593_008089, partial [Microsporum audouinii]
LLELELGVEQDLKVLEVLEGQKNQIQQLIKYKQKKAPNPKTQLQTLEERISNLEKKNSN